jgi:hypothetical protein
MPFHGPIGYITLVVGMRSFPQRFAAPVESCTLLVDVLVTILATTPATALLRGFLALANGRRGMVLSRALPLSPL